jgi:hypothetical protein
MHVIIILIYLQHFIYYLTCKNVLGDMILNIFLCQNYNGNFISVIEFVFLLFFFFDLYSGLCYFILMNNDRAFLPKPPPV